MTEAAGQLARAAPPPLVRNWSTVATQGDEPVGEEEEDPGDIELRPEGFARRHEILHEVLGLWNWTRG